MHSVNSSCQATSPCVERRDISAGIWADFVNPSVGTRLEEHLENEFDRIVRRTWPAPGAHSHGDLSGLVAAPAHASPGVLCARSTVPDGGLVTDPSHSPRSASGPAADSTDAAREDAPKGIPTDLLGQLALLDSLVEAITSTDPASVPGSVAAEASARVHRGVSRLTAQRSGWIGRVESEGLWGLETMHSFTSWLAKTEGLSSSLARRTVTAARALRDHLPVTAAQARAGIVTEEHVAIMVRTASTDAIRAALRAPVDSEDREDPAAATFAQKMSGGVGDDAVGVEDVAPGPDHAPLAPHSHVGSGEEMLLGLAAGRQLADFTRVAKYFAAVSDPDAQDKSFSDAAAKEFLQLSPTIDGVQVSGFLTTEHGQRSPPRCARSPASPPPTTSSPCLCARLRL